MNVECLCSIYYEQKYFFWNCPVHGVAATSNYIKKIEDETNSYLKRFRVYNPDDPDMGLHKWEDEGGAHGV